MRWKSGIAKTAEEGFGRAGELFAAAIFVLREQSTALVRDDRSVLKASTAVFGTVAFCKGLGFPSLWATTQAQVDLSHGFVKRGLFGQIFTRPLHLQQYDRFAAFSLGVLAIATVLLIVLCVKSGVLWRVGDGAPAAVFASSMAVTFLSHLAGYFNVLQLALVLALLLVRRSLLRFVLAIPLCLFCLLLHEAFLLMFMPLVLFSFLTDVADGRTSRQAARGYVTVLTIAALILSVGIAAKRARSGEQTATMYREFQSHVDFPLQVEFFDVYNRSISDNLHLTLAMHFSGQEAGAELASLIMFGPVLAFLFFYLGKICKTAGSGLVARWGLPFVAAVGAGPLAMQLLGWDVGRWYCFACIDIFIALALLIRSMPNLYVPVRSSLFRVALFVIALNMASGDTMMAGKVPNPYPFIRPFQHTLRDIMHGRSVRPF